MRSYELQVLNGNQKSFYGKAVVKVKDNGDKILTSYTTDVAGIYDGVPVINDYYSSTTTKHVKEFMQQELGNRFVSMNTIKGYVHLKVVNEETGEIEVLKF